MSPSRGRLIAFEGGEACGKSTQARLLAERLDAVLTREPGGTPTGEQIRTILLDHDTGDLDPRTETLLVAAARAEHVATVIRPALDAGRWVVTDRFSGLLPRLPGRRPGAARRGGGRGLALGHRGPRARPGGLPRRGARGRARRARAGVATASRRPATSFHLAVAEGFRKQAAEHADRWVTFDGARPIDELAAEIAAEVSRRFAG